MALAIEQDIQPSETANTETVWNVGTFDPNNEIRNLIISLYPSVDSPYATTEHFINEGLDIIENHLEENKELNIIELIQ